MRKPRGLIINKESRVAWKSRGTTNFMSINRDFIKRKVENFVS